MGSQILYKIFFSLIILVSCETWVIRGTTIRPANEYPFVCPQPDGYSPHPYNSSQYYLCRNGNSYLMTCPADTVFDGRQTCIDAFRCPQYDGNFTIANNRRQYYQCTNGRHVLMTCSYGTYFDELTRRCITGGRDDRDREPDYVSCPKEEDRFAHPSNQSQYYECHSGRYVLRSCPYGLYYDEQAQYCIRFGNQFYCPQPNGVFADPEDITRYYECHNNRPAVRSCPHSHSFDGQKCYQHYRCPTPNGMFRSPHSRYDYYECRSDVPTLKTCLTGWEFSESYGQCVESERRQPVTRLRIISGRIEFDDNGVRVVDVWSVAEQQWKRTYGDLPFEEKHGVFVPAYGTQDNRSALYQRYK